MYNSTPRDDRLWVHIKHWGKYDFGEFSLRSNSPEKEGLGQPSRGPFAKSALRAV